MIRPDLSDELSLLTLTAVSLGRSMTYLEVAANRLRAASDPEGEHLLRGAIDELQVTLQALEPYERGDGA